MSNLKVSKPSFIFGYWRPWKENSNLIDSYLDYARDTSLVKYGADTLGKYIQTASKDQIAAVKSLELNILGGLDVINHSLNFINRNLDIQIEQQKLSNLLLQNIIELLKVPDSEKERQHCIELGIKFFVSAKKDPDLYADALEELLKAEALMKQDYFVLHRIGCLYLYAKDHINPQLALDYFIRAAKYSSVDSESNVERLAKFYINDSNSKKTQEKKQKNSIGILASASYEKAAFAAYVLGRIEDAVSYQTKSLKFDNTNQNRFLLAKYQVRHGLIAEAVINLEKCIISQPEFASAVFKEIDLINEPKIIQLIASKNEEINSRIKTLIAKWKTIESEETEKVLIELNTLLEKPYDQKISDFEKFSTKSESVNSALLNLELLIDELIIDMKSKKFISLDEKSLEEITVELKKSKELPLEIMETIYNKCKLKLEKDELKIGARHQGGIVFYIDKTGEHGLVVAEKKIAKAIWGAQGAIDAKGNGIADGTGMQNTIQIVEQSSWFVERGFFSSTKTPAPTAARLCKELDHNGFRDWYLPTIKELELLQRNYKLKTNAEYWSSTEYGLTKLNAFLNVSKNIDNAWYIINDVKRYDYKDSRWSYFLYDLKPNQPNVKSVVAIRKF